MARKKVYVSSTFKDLEEHRSAVKATLEYEEAMRLKRPCLSFLLDPDAPWKRGFQDADSHSPDSAISRFRDHVEKRHGRSFYTTPDSLDRAIHEALRAEEQKHLTDSEKAKAQIRERSTPQPLSLVVGRARISALCGSPHAKPRG